MTADDKPPLPERRSDDSGPGVGAASVSRREFTSRELFAGRREIRIRHAEGVYTLRQTGKGKLILTK